MIVLFGSDSTNDLKLIQKTSILFALPFISVKIKFFINLGSPFKNLQIEINYKILCKLFRIFKAKFVFSGLIVPSVAMVCLGNCDPSKPLLAYTYLVIAIGFSGSSKPGFFLNQLDIAPNYAGTLMGIVNGFSNAVAMLSILTCHYFVQDEVRI